MKKYDAIVVLGYGFTKDWELQLHSVERLRIVAGLYKSGVAMYVLVCGKWSIHWDHAGIVPSTTEAELMKHMLEQFGVRWGAIVVEKRSKDTIGNLYFAKKLLEKRNKKKILIVCADFHLKRVRFLVSKIFPIQYIIDYVPTQTQSMYSQSTRILEEKILKEQNGFLAAMKNGDDTFLKKRLYNDQFYKIERSKEEAERGMGETK